MKHLFKHFVIGLILMTAGYSHANESLSYTGRLVNADGSPVTGDVDLKVELAYTDNVSFIICSKTISPVPLASGVFHIKINYSTADCGGKTTSQVLAEAPPGETAALRVTDLTNTKTYSFHALHALPYAVVAKTVSSHGATAGQILKWDGTKWSPATDGGAGIVDLQAGTGIDVASVDADTWSIAIANLGVGNAQLAGGAVTDSKVSATAAIARSKLASGTANHVLVNDGSGVMSSVAALSITQGGTSATTASGARANLGLGTAAIANIGTSSGNVLGVDNLLTCTTGEKLIWNNPPTIGWSCIGDESTDSTKLPLAGGTMSGVINMGTFGITNLAAPTNNSDAATKNYVDSQITGNTFWTFNLGDIYRTTGNVGIGSSAPASKLHVSNDSADASSGIRIETTKVGSERAYEFAVQTGGKFGIYDTASATPRITLDTLGNLGIGTISPQSILDITSTTSGLLIPRLTTVQRDAIVTPATGLQVYNVSTNELQYYNGTAWQALGVAGSGVTSITAGTGLLGGTITTSGTIDIDVGTTASKIVQLDGSAKLPAVDGSLLTNLSPANFGSVVPITKGGTGLSAGGALNTMLGMNAAGTALEYKALSATGLTITHGAGTLDLSVSGAPPTGTASGDLSGTYPSPVVDKIQGIPVDTTDPTSAQILVYSGAAYVPTSISGDATLSAAGALTLGTVPVTKGGTGVTALTAKGIVSVNALGTGLVSTNCASGEVLSFDGTGNVVCTATSSFTSDSFIQNGNSFGAGAVLGTNDAFPLSFETNGTTKMTVLSDGKVGIGTAGPGAILDIASTTSGVLIPRMTTVQRDAIATPGAMQIYNTTTNKINFHNGTSWQELGIAGDGVTSITAGTGLTGGTITTTGTIAVDVGTAAGKIVQLDGSAKLPAVDGSLLTNLSPANFGSVVPITKGGTGLSAAGAANTLLGMDAAGTAMEYKALSATSPLALTHGVGTVALDLGTVPVTKGGTGLTSFTGDRVYVSNNLGTALQTFSCSSTELFGFSALGVPTCNSISSLSGFVQNGNSFGAGAVLGTNDAFPLSFETNGSTAMTILSGGNVGIGTTSPTSLLSVNNGNVVASGTFGTSPLLPNPPAGSHLIWYPRKAALRAGDLSTTNWNESNIGNHSIGLGTNTLASTWRSIAIGHGATASLGNDPIAIGTSSIANTGGAIALGTFARASGDRSVAIGSDADSRGFAETVLGSFNVLTTGSATAWVATDPLFTIGNGSSSTTRSNAMVILKNGNVGIGTTNPQTSLDLSAKTDAVRLPSGTTAQRPSTPANGDIRYNATTAKLEAYVAGQWITVAGGGSNGLRDCNTGNPNDVMVAVGNWCVDKYEASVWSAADGTGTQYFSTGTTANFNYPDAGNLPASFNRNGSGTSVVYAASKPGVVPARGITWFQAAVACANSGKQLVPDSVWVTAALGTVDPGTPGSGGTNGGSATDVAAARCNINSHGANNDVDGDATWNDTGNKVRRTARAGTTPQGTDACISRFGVEDMVGNVWEWTDAGSVPTGVDTAGFSQGKSNAAGNPFSTADTSWNVNGSAYGCDGPGSTAGTCGWKNNVPAAALRGGDWSYGTNAGVFALILVHSGSYSGWAFGFRCARSR